MDKFYEVLRELYQDRFVETNRPLVAKADPEGKRPALAAAIAKAERLLDRMGRKADEGRAAGRNVRSLNAEGDRLAWVLTSLRLLMVNINDVDIVAAKAEIDHAIERLEAANEASVALADDLTKATAAIDALAKILNLF